MKVLKNIKKVILTILGILFFAFALGMSLLLLNFNDYGVTQFNDTSLILIKENISSKDFKKGDLVLVESRKLDQIKVGDTAFAYHVDSKGKATVDVGVVGTKYDEDKAIAFENGSTYSIDFVIGESTKVYDNVGTYLSVIESKWGFLFIILVPGFMIFLYEVYALIVEIKYGDEDTTDDEEKVKSVKPKKEKKKLEE